MSTGEEMKYATGFIENDKGKVCQTQLFIGNL